jgi:hypothetical protein
MPMLPSRRIGRALAVLVLLTVFLSGAQDAVAGNVEGTACSAPGAVAPIYNSANDDGNNLVCLSGTWQYPAYVVQSYSGSPGASCSGYPVGALHYTTTASEIEFCNGTNWNFLAAGSTSCGTPSGLSFTNLTSQALGVSVTSNTATITFTGCSGAVAVSVSGAATAQISVNGGAWATSGAISSGQTLQVRMTTSGSVSTVLTATVTVNATSTNWTTTTRSGSLTIFATPILYYGSGIGGLSGADALCQSAASTAGYAGTFKAVMCDATTNASTRLSLSYPIVNAYGGSTVAATNLWSGTIANEIYTPSGGLSSGYYTNIWTGCTYAGNTSAGNTCSSWSSSSGNGETGLDNTTTQWLQVGTIGCSSWQLSIYCIQQ